MAPMPGKHTGRQKRQAEHVADSERKRGVEPKRAESIGWATVNARKGIQVVSLEDYYDSVMKARAEQDAGEEKARLKKFPREMSPMARMRPVSDDEAADKLRKEAKKGSDHVKKSLGWLTALKALATGYTKVSGGGALKAPNRPSTSSKKSPKVFDGGAATELSNSLKNVVNKSGGPMANTNFNDLFKSELGASTEGVLCDCPHCEAPITKSDLAKAHKGKGKATNLSGPKHGKSSAHVVDQNPEGGVMRGGEGRGVHTPSRGVPGAKKTDAPVGVQNSKGSRARKGGDDDTSGDDVGSGEDVGKASVKKSITYRGTEYVTYVDDGSDAALAKAILEGSLGGTSPTQPLDLNNDLTRLLV